MIKVANDAQAALGDRKIPLQVAVMGCVVNGPGEAREADLGIAAGRGRGHLFVKGKVVRVVPEAEMVEALVAEAERIMEEGIDAVLASADAGAEAEAEADRGRAARRAGRRREPRRREDRPHPRDRGADDARGAPQLAAMRPERERREHGAPLIPEFLWPWIGLAARGLLAAIVAARSRVPAGTRSDPSPVRAARSST